MSQLNESIPPVQVLIVTQSWEGKLHTLVENTQYNSDGCFSQRDLKEKQISMLKIEITYMFLYCVWIFVEIL